MSSPAQLAHVILRTYDVPTVAQWYLRALDGRVVLENPAMTFMTYDDEHHRIGIVQLPGEAPDVPAPRTTGLDHFAFTVATIDGLLDHYSQMKNAGYVPVLTVNHGPTVSFYYKDPDGNNVEFFVECFATAEEANEFVASPALQGNPMGHAVDPDEMMARRKAGASEAELLAYDAEAPVDPAKIMEQIAALA
jgi:catechol-2,3-dioxygenase